MKLYTSDNIDDILRFHNENVYSAFNHITPNNKAPGLVHSAAGFYKHWTILSPLFMND